MTSQASKSITELFDLSGKVAMVTGGAGHLGQSMCYALAELGATVVVASRNLDNCEAFAQELAGKGFKASAVALDIQNTHSCRQAIDEVLAYHGRIDVLVNNSYPFNEKRIDALTDEDFQATQQSTTGTFRLSQLASLSMRENGGGSVINIGSMYGLVGSYPEMYEGLEACISASYHAAKGSILQLTRYLAVYWAELGIRVNAISPGPFPKEAVRDTNPGFMDKLEQKVPLKRIGQPDELKGAIALLASQAGSYITGQNIVVDGGWTAW